MKRFRRLSAFISLALLLFAVIPSIAEDLTSIKPTGYVTDLAGVISPGTRTQLESLCTELEQKTGAQLAIVTVKSLEGESAEQYASNLFKQLGIGKKKLDTGVMLLVAPTERKYWTEVGYGLEPVINDARAGDAGRAMVPFFRQGDYSGGIAAAAWKLAGYIADDKGVTLSGRPAASSVPDSPHSSKSSPPFWLVFWVLVLIFRIFASVYKHFRGRKARSSSWWIWPMGGGSSGGSSWSGGGWGGSSGGGFGGFGGGSSGGGGAGGSW